MKKLYSMAVVAFVTLMYGQLAFARKEINLDDSAGDGMFAGFINLLQAFIDVVTGPWAIFIGLIGVVVAVSAWLFAKDTGPVITFGLKALAAVFALFSAPTIILAMYSM